MGKIGNQQMLRDINKSLLLHLVYHHGPISRVDLARRTKLSPTTVSVLMEDAIREGMIHETGTSGSGVGRRMTLLDIREDNGFVLGFDLSNAPARCVLLNLRGKVMAMKPLRKLIGEQEIRSGLAAMIDGFVAEERVPRELIRWVGLSLPGWLDEERDRLIYSDYLQVRDMPLRRMLHEALGLPVGLVNDLDAAGFAERFSGSAKGLHTIVYILIGYGVGAGLVLRDQIYRGVAGKAGMIGDFYPYGTEILAARLAAQYPEAFGEGEPDEKIARFVRLGLQGEAPYAAELGEITERIASYCGNMVQLLDPEQLILSGWISEHEAYLAELTARIRHYEGWNRREAPVPVQAPYWKEYGAAIGAATLGLHQLFKMKTVD
ncbi:Sugar kinase of the NBD/HSP70 family, may contain an N-terminal HTH domain [Paenibacillus sp. UNCCL117]|uniref:ROK family transcriptional regulator n=1 Tax=unclassified Paenibacillus TaxID=185978 RepID=UPI00088BAF35|nr:MULTISPECIES: ROK family transcriptional regulator [unclassified Paenibacillus]SDC67855.1 Sugar kinase of the NBD/HSP70 family, may contain an N-terminal HTH domain [Paenibacillus sp. cl123]SFW23450.1 Sugar kinase of the NBD/HSP70 family, may contain an N-terminal HTH domain [Paenibacillus sp. UNCCL117]